MATLRLPMRLDPEALTLTEIIQMQTRLSETLKRRFERNLALASTDVVGSTPFFARYGDQAGRQLQQRHFDLLQKATSDVGGTVIDKAGDGALTVFPSAEAGAVALVALAVAISSQNATFDRERQLVIRSALHFGPVLTDGQRATGDAVHVVGNVASTGGGGEIRLTRQAFLELPASRRLRCIGVPPCDVKGMVGPQTLMALEWRDRANFPTRIRVRETGEEIALPDQDSVAFGRLREQNGIRANDVVLLLPDEMQARQVSRWHFELRRRFDGYVLRSVSDALTEVDGVSVAKGQDVRVRPGSVCQVSRVLTLDFLAGNVGDVDADDADSTVI